MNWALVAWTAVGWLFVSLLLYLSFEFGRDTGLVADNKRQVWQSWKNGVLVVLIFFTMVIFGTGSGPDDADPSYHEVSLTPEDWSRMLGIVIAFVCAYSLGFLDGRRARKHQERGAKK